MVDIQNVINFTYLKEINDNEFQYFIVTLAKGFYWNIRNICKAIYSFLTDFESFNIEY